MSCASCLSYETAIGRYGNELWYVNDNFVGGVICQSCNNRKNTKRRRSYYGENNPFYNKKHSENTRKRMSESGRIKIFKDSHRKSLSLANSGDNNPMHGIHRYGRDNPNWKGGVTNINFMIRNSDKYIVWRKACFERDEYSCNSCGIKSKNIEVHHLVRVADIINIYKIYNLEDAYKCDILWDIDNGITLCNKCHDTITYGYKDDVSVICGGIEYAN